MNVKHAEGGAKTPPFKLFNIINRSGQFHKFSCFIRLMSGSMTALIASPRLVIETNIVVVLAENLVKARDILQA